jgi:hypothetical protein
VDATEAGFHNYDASQEFVCWSAAEFQHLSLDSTEQENLPFIVDSGITGNGYALDPDRIWLEYSVTRPRVWIQVDMQYMGSGQWQATIPGQEHPKEVAYFIHAENVLGDVATAPRDGMDDPFLLDVAWLVEPFERTDCGFIVNPDGDDDATSGIWEHADLDLGTQIWEPAQRITHLSGRSAGSRNVDTPMCAPARQPSKARSTT